MIEDSMISFIVIGRNEGWRLSKCFEGLNKVIKYNKLIDFEIIYVDSDSNDKSIEIAKSNNVNRIYKISGNVNAAIARNVGANESLGEILFFLDGDIEVNPFHFSDIIRGNNILNYGYVVGFLDDVNYDSNWNFINQTPRHYKEIIQDKVVTKANVE
jgi:glycosyltransferase involved in cell wall biosynthesis